MWLLFDQEQYWFCAIKNGRPSVPILQFCLRNSTLLMLTLSKTFYIVKFCTEFCFTIILSAFQCCFSYKHRTNPLSQLYSVLILCFQMSVEASEEFESQQELQNDYESQDDRSNDDAGQDPDQEDQDQDGQDEDHDNSFIIKLRGLPWTVTNKDIVNFLKDIAIADGENGVHLITYSRNSTRPNGEAFVVCASENDYKKSFYYNKKTIGKRYIESKLHGVGGVGLVRFFLNKNFFHSFQCSTWRFRKYYAKTKHCSTRHRCQIERTTVAGHWGGNC